MNCKTDRIDDFAMLLASGSPGSALAWLRNTEAELVRRPAAAEDAFSRVVDELDNSGRHFNFLP